MLTNKKIHLALSVLIFAYCLTAAAPVAQAEHIFFNTRINNKSLVGSESGNELNLLSNNFEAFQEPENTIVSLDGKFVFNLTCFNLSKFGEGGIVTLSFVAGETSTLPSPLPQVFNYDGNGTEKKPSTFEFSQFFPPGVFVGDLILNYVSTEGEPENRVIVYPITLISQPIPEPATMVLLGTGLGGLIAGARRRRKSAAK